MAGKTGLSAVWHDEGKRWEIRELPRPETEPDGVSIRVQATNAVGSATTQATFEVMVAVTAVSTLTSRFLYVGTTDQPGDFSIGSAALPSTGTATSPNVHHQVSVFFYASAPLAPAP